MIGKQIIVLTFWLISPLILFASEYHVATSDVNVRNGPGKEHSILFTLQKGDYVEVLSKNGPWYKIKLDEKPGYVHSKYLESKSITDDDIRKYFIAFFVLVGFIGLYLFEQWLFAKRRERRRDYYRNVYLQSDEWQRKRYVVLKRDNWRCVYCNDLATQVHHKRYAKINIGKEPIEWLVSVCKHCHEVQHN